MWPTTISHRIDVNSPLYGLSSEQLDDGRVEVICWIKLYRYFHLSFQGDCERGWRAQLGRFNRQQDELHWQRDCLGSQVDSLIIIVSNFFLCLLHRFIHSSVTPCPDTEGYLASFTQEEIDRFERVTNL